MKYLIHFVAVLVFSFSMSIAEAQNKVVVIPMGGSRTPGKGGILTGEAITLPR